MRFVALPLTFLVTTLVVAQAPGARRQAAAPAAPPAQSATVPLSNYQRAAALQARFAGKTLDAIDAPVWLASGKLGVPQDRQGRQRLRRRGPGDRHEDTGIR